MREQTLFLTLSNGSFVDNLIDVIVFPPNESSETHIIQERCSAKAPSLAGDAVL